MSHMFLLSILVKLQEAWTSDDDGKRFSNNEECLHLKLLRSKVGLDVY
jgi:hypothetical protein